MAAQMFGNVGTVKIADGTFNNAAGNQYNSIGGPPPAGWSDPHWDGHLGLPSVGRTRSAPGSAQMFGDVSTLEGQNSTFNNASGTQHNYTVRGPGAPGAVGVSHAQDHSSRRNFAPSLPHKSASAPTHVNPPPTRPSDDLTPQAAVARMFGNVARLDTIDSTFNNSAGEQSNIRFANDSYGYTATSGSADNNISAPNPEKKGHNNPFTKLLHSHQTPASHPEPASVPTLPPSPKPNRVDQALGIAGGVMQTLQAAAEFSPVPFLSQAAASVVTIIQAVQSTRDNTGAFSRLAEHACTLVSSVVITQQKRAREGKQLAPELVDSLELLVTKLKPIEKFVTGQAARHGIRGNVKRLINHKMEAGQLREYTEKLTQALAEFGLRSNITVQDGVAQIDQKLEDLIAAFERMGTSGRREPVGESAHQDRPILHTSHSESSVGGRSSRNPTPPPQNRNYSAPSQEYPASQSPTTNYPSSSADYSSPYKNHPSRFHAPAMPPLNSLPSTPGSTFNFVGGNQNNNQNTYYPGPTYNVQGHNIQGNTYNGVEGGVHYH